jgi:nucleotide-binding universal stress UspA family protein
MSLKNLLLHLDQSERSAARLGLAVSLARRHGARLLGLFGQRAQALRVGVVASWPSPDYVAARDASQAAFHSACADLPGAEWRDVNRGGDAELLRHITDLARHADLVIMGQHDGQAPASVPEDLVGDVILDCGRPVLVVPYVGEFPDVGRHPLIAWNNARESARALCDSLVLIQGCDLAHVLSFSTRLEEGESSCAEVQRHLAAHGVQARSEVILVENFGIMDVLLNRVSDRSADLLVMGAHAHIGFPFDNRGTGTRYILRHMTVPVLMSN